MSGLDLSNEDDWKLIVPLKVLRRNGGPYDDEAFIAGWQFGVTTTLIRMGVNPELIVTHPSMRAEYDVLAMGTGLAVEFSERDDGLMDVRFRKVSDEGEAEQ